MLWGLFVRWLFRLWPWGLFLLFLRLWSWGLFLLFLRLWPWGLFLRLFLFLLDSILDVMHTPE